MSEKLNLLEILKDCMIGTRLYSPALGECIFAGYAFKSDSPEQFISVLDRNNKNWLFSKDGIFTDTGTECQLFPSLVERDWTNIEILRKLRIIPPKQEAHAVHNDSECTFRDFDLVLARNSTDDPWMPDIFLYRSKVSENSNKYIYVCARREWKFCIPYAGNEKLKFTRKNPDNLV